MILDSSYQFLPEFIRSVIDQSGKVVESVSKNMTVLSTNTTVENIESLLFYQVYGINRYDGDRLIIPARFDTGIFETFDGGDSFVRLEPPVDFQRKPVEAIVYGGQVGSVISKDLVILGGREYILIREGPSTAPFTPLTSFPPFGIIFPWIHDLAVHPFNWKHMVVLFAFGEVAETTDGGATWSVLPPLIVGTFGDKDSNQTNILLVPLGNEGTILVSGRTGIYMLSSDRAGWLRLSGLPNAFIANMRYNVDNDLLYASTLGRGVWYLEKASKEFAAQNKPLPTPLSWRTNFFILLGFTLLFSLTVIVLGVLLFRHLRSGPYTRLTA